MKHAVKTQSCLAPLRAEGTSTSPPATLQLLPGSPLAGGRAGRGRGRGRTRGRGSVRIGADESRPAQSCGTLEDVSVSAAFATPAVETEPCEQMPADLQRSEVNTEPAAVLQASTPPSTASGQQTREIAALLVQPHVVSANMPTTTLTKAAKQPEILIEDDDYDAED